MATATMTMTSSTDTQQFISDLIVERDTLIKSVHDAAIKLIDDPHPTPAAVQAFIKALAAREIGAVVIPQQISQAQKDKDEAELRELKEAYQVEWKAYKKLVAELRPLEAVCDNMLSREQMGLRDGNPHAHIDRDAYNAAMDAAQAVRDQVSATSARLNRITGAVLNRFGKDAREWRS